MLADRQTDRQTDRHRQRHRERDVTYSEEDTLFVSSGRKQQALYNSSDTVHGCMVYTERAETAAKSRQYFHVALK